MIVPVEPCRDVHGYWTHPALIRSCCQTTPDVVAARTKAGVFCDDNARRSDRGTLCWLE